MLFEDEKEVSKHLELKENTTETRNLWLDHNNNEYNQYLFLKLWTKIPIQCYEQKTLDENKTFKNTTVDCTKKCYKERFDNLTELESLRILHSSYIKTYLHYIND